MKKMFFIQILALLVPCIQMMGQEGVQAGWNGAEMSSNNVTNKMLVDGKQWVYRHHVETWNWETMWPEEVDTKVTYMLNGDTLIKGWHYAKLYRQEEDEAPVYSMALRQPGKKVYCYERDAEEEKLFIAFDPPFFSPSLMNPYIENLIDRIDEVTVNGRTFTRHRYYKKESDDWWEAIFVGVEGVGFEHTGILGMNFAMNPSNYMTFEACYEDGECIFTAEDFEKPDSNSIVVATLSRKSPQQRGIFDLQGRRVMGQPKPGIYVVDGKKQVVK